MKRKRKRRDQFFKYSAQADTTDRTEEDRPEAGREREARLFGRQYI